MKALLVAAVVLFHCLCAASAGDAKKPGDNYEILRTTTIFAFGGVGAGGTRVSAELAFDEVVKSRDASATFQRLLSTATPEGKLYALAGLYRVDRDAFASALPSYSQNKAEVHVARGCILSTEPTEGITKQIEAGRYK